MPTLRALVIVTAGTNCDLELAEAFRLAGAAPETVHLQRLIDAPALMDRYELIGLPGGFSYGDAVAAGRIQAQLIRRHLYDRFTRAIERGVPIFAPCNGFQVAVQAGLLPGPALGEPWPTEPALPTAALADNAIGRFADCWTRVEFPADSRCIWTQGLDDDDERLARLPCAHGEGRFVADESLLARLRANGQVALRYAEGDNFNGSADRIAGICDASGLVFGLMPHPERFTRWTQHPFWTRLDDAAMHGEPLGLRMFRNAVRHALQVAV